MYARTLNPDPVLTGFRRRALSQHEKLDYLAAIKCMMATPGRTTDLYPGVSSAYDDYQALHISMTDYIHFVVGDT